MSGQRAFANKINKRAAADVRKQITSSGIFPDSGSKSHSLNLSLSSLQNSILENVTEPPNYEEIICQSQSVIDRDNLKQILEFPYDDLQSQVIRHKPRTVAPISPSSGINPDRHVSDCIKNYTKDYYIVNQKYEHFVDSHNNREERAQRVRDSTKPEFEINTLDVSINRYNRECGPSSSRKSSISTTSESSASLTNHVLDNSAADPLLPDLLINRPLEDVDLTNEKARKNNRQMAIFSLYPMQPEEEQIENRQPIIMPVEHFGHRFLVRCVQLKLDIEIEPIFATMALYNIREHKKISENFYFDLSSPSMHKMLESHVLYSDFSTMSRTAIFEITHPSPDIFLVVKLEKVLQQGDISEVAEPYINKDERLRERAKANAPFYCSRLGKYRMPFAWTNLNLMNIIAGSGTVDGDRESIRSDSLERKGSLLSGKSGTPDKRSSWTMDEVGQAIDTFRPVTINLTNFYKQEADKLSDDDLYKNLIELKKQTYASKKLKQIPVTMKLDISPCSAENKYCLTPELYRVEPYPDADCRPTKEILEFPIKEILKPHTTYRNLLYVYPKSLNFANRQGSARNIAVKIQLMEGENESQVLPAIFAKSNCPEIAKEYNTIVNYHNKTPTFYDEVKIKLPVKINENHHLLFTIYHVSCQQKREMVELDQIIGYTWLPLMRDDRLIVGEMCLPVSQDALPQHYSTLHPDVQLPSMKWVDNHRGLFTVSVEAVSSVHTLDEHLDRFLSLVNAYEDDRIPPRIGEENFVDELKRSIENLTLSANGPLVRFSPLIFNKLLHLLYKPPIINQLPVNTGPIVFEALVHMVRRFQVNLDLLRDKHGRNVLLVSYIKYLCSLPYVAPGPLAAGSYATLGRNGNTLNGRSYTRQVSGSDPDVSKSQLEFELNNGCKLVHEEIVEQWIQSSGTISLMAFSTAWFFFELILKSMTDNLVQKGALISNRKSRYPPKLMEGISSLVSLVIKEIGDMYCSGRNDTSQLRSLNTSLAFFIRGCLTIMDRGYIFNLIKLYCKGITNRLVADISGLLSYKLEFLRIVSYHEHYIALNLPFRLPIALSSPPSPSTSSTSSTSQQSLVSAGNAGEFYTELTSDYKTQHYLVGLLLTELSNILDLHQPILHLKAINILTNLLSSHDLDPRYQSPDARSRIASLYAPLLSIIIDALPQLNDPGQDSRVKANENESHPIDQTLAMAIAGPAAYNTSELPGNRKIYLSFEATQDLLICLLWIMKNMDKVLLKLWWSNISPNKLSLILDLIYLSYSNFEYKVSRRDTPIYRCNTYAPSNSAEKFSKRGMGKKVMRHYSIQTAKRSVDMKSRMEDYIIGSASARSEMMRRKLTDFSSPNGDQSARLRWRKDQISYKQTPEMNEINRIREENDSFLEGLLSAETSLILLDSIEIIIQIVQSIDSLQNMLSQILRILLHALSLNQSSFVLQNLFDTQRALVTKFPELLFEEDTEQCADLCLRLLRHCSSSLPSIRMHSSASLYMLMRQNFEIGNNFARVKMQVTMSLSSLVGQNQNCSENYLRASLKTLLVYADADSELADTTFPEQVKELVLNLHMILSDTIKMKEFQSDPEMLLDLMYRIAKGYQNSPDLRLTWLQNMAAKHSERKNFAEAAQCLIHAAGLVAEYLNMLEEKPHLPIGCVVLQNVSRNVLEESAVSEDVVSPDSEGVCTGKYFTESGFIGLLEQACSSFEMAGMYEAMNNTYKALIPIYEYNHDFKKLASVHSKLYEAFQAIIRLEGKRVFGTYFRVGFYGSYFSDLDGQEFIYKEPAITKLPEISHRLESFYMEKFGNNVVEMIKDSNVVDKDNLDPNKAYIQITFVEPYFDLFELRDRVTFFEKNYNIKRFMYATPFTRDGRAHGELRDQFKRKTILTTLNSFPYVKTRLNVMAKESFILSPIEVAIEDIQKKTKELGLALMQDPPDAKMLQMVLQGCIGAIINQGPVEMAIVFLTPNETISPSKFHNKLRSCFKDFLKKCGDALHRNKSLICDDQKEYQRELERNYVQIKDQLLPIIQSRQNGELSRLNSNKRNY